jgi:hypothetical protein
VANSEPNEVLRIRFAAIDAAELDAMKARAEPEGLHLDFKRMEPSGEPSSHDKDNLAEALAGFANSDGGIVLWGVNTKDANGKEQHRFSSLVPLHDGRLARKRLTELTGDSTSPPVSGVAHDIVQVEGGYVVKTLIPASDAAPHRTQGGKGQYFRRAADRFRYMEHYEIADMFGRRARPRLDFWHTDLSLKAGSKELVEFVVGVVNTGRGMARFPSLTLWLLTGQDVQLGSWGLSGSSAQGVCGLPMRPRRFGDTSLPYVFGGGADHVIHPGETLEVARIEVQVVRKNAPIPKAAIRWRVAALGTEAVEGDWSATGDELWTRFVQPAQSPPNH